MHSLSTLIGRDFWFRARLSKMKSARQCRCIVADVSVTLSIPWPRARNFSSNAALLWKEQTLWSFTQSRVRWSVRPGCL